MIHNPSHHTTIPTYHPAHNTTIPTYHHPVLFCFLITHSFIHTTIVGSSFRGEHWEPHPQQPPTHVIHITLSFEPIPSHSLMFYQFNTRCGVSCCRGTRQYTPPTSQFIIQIVVCRFAGGRNHKRHTYHTTHTPPFIKVFKCPHSSYLPLLVVCTCSPHTYAPPDTHKHTTIFVFVIMFWSA